jgi:hypothetical protein
MTLLYIFSTLNDRGLLLSDADSDPIDIKLKRERRTKAEERSLSNFLLRKQLKVTLKQGCNDFKIILSKAIRLESCSKRYKIALHNSGSCSLRQLEPGHPCCG